jgi:hypothetical protein
MDAYATFTKVERVRPRRVAARGRDVWAFDPAHDDEALDPDAAPIDLVLGERIERLRELWSQTTFFLFDGEGWR